jgi:hypothetical protein
MFGKRNYTSSALSGAATVYLLPWLLSWPIGDFHFGAADWIVLGGFVFLGIMSFWARFAPLPPAVAGLAAYLILVWSQSPPVAQWPVLTWIVHASIVLLLLLALFSAVKRPFRAVPSNP